MKKIFGILLAAVLVLMNAVCLAEAEGTAVPEGKDEPTLLTCRESAIPFYPVQWGMKLKEVVEATGGEDMGNKADVQAAVTIPGISEPAPAVFHCGKKGLESVSITVLNTADAPADYEDTEEGTVVFNCAEAFFNSIDDSSRLQVNNDVSYVYRNDFSDALIGYIENGSGYSLVMEFYKPIEFNQKAFRDNKRFYMTTETSGAILFFNEVKIITGFDTDYSRSNKTARTFNAFSPKIILVGSQINPAYSVPGFAIVYAYAGTVQPPDVATVTFTVDGTMYRFTEVKGAKMSKTEYNEYSKQYTIWMTGANSSFMEALEKSKKKVTVELRGMDFSLMFDMPPKAKAGLITDWKQFKKANGTDPGFLKMLETIKTPMTVY